MTGERHHLGGDPRPALGYPRGIERSVGLVEQTHGGKDANDQVVVREINVHRSIEWEGLRGGNEGAVGLQAVVWKRIRETPDEFVDVPDALNSSKGTPIPDETNDQWISEGGGM